MNIKHLNHLKKKFQNALYIMEHGSEERKKELLPITRRNLERFWKKILTC